MRVIVISKIPHRVTQNSDSNNVPIEGRKNGSLMFFHVFCFKILYLFLMNNPPKINFLEKNTLVPSYSRDCFENVLKSDFCSPF